MDAQTLEDVVATSAYNLHDLRREPEFKAVRKRYGDINDRVALMLAYSDAEALDYRDAPYVETIMTNPTEEFYVSVNRNAHDPDLLDSLEGLEGEKLAVFMAMRLFIQLTTAMRQVWGPEALAQAYRRFEGHLVPGPVELPPGVGFDLAADLTLACPPVFAYWRAGDSERIYPQQDPPYSSAWTTLLGNGQVETQAYTMMRSYYLYLAYRSRHTEGPTVVQPRNLILGFAESITAHFQRGRLQLPPRATHYLQYVARVLLNYYHYGVVGLRPSDLLDGDAVFSPVLTDVGETLLQLRVPMAEVLKTLTLSYLERPPTDAEVLARLLAL